MYPLWWGFPGGASGKEPACQCRRHRDASSIPGRGRSPGGANGNPPPPPPAQYSCLENPMDGGGWRVTVHGVTKSRTRKRFSTAHPLWYNIEAPSEISPVTTPLVWAGLSSSWHIFNAPNKSHHLMVLLRFNSSVVNCDCLLLWLGWKYKRSLSTVRYFRIKSGVWDSGRGLGTAEVIILNQF